MLICLLFNIANLLGDLLQEILVIRVLVLKLCFRGQQRPGKERGDADLAAFSQRPLMPTFWALKIFAQANLSLEKMDGILSCRES